MNINVSGSIKSLQSSLDFYLNMTTVKGYKSLDDMRNKMFKEFMKEEDNREDSYYAVDISEFSEDQKTNNSVLDNEDCINEYTTNMFDYVSHGMFVENYVVKGICKDVIDNEIEVVENTIELKREYVCNGRYVEDYNIDAINKFTEVSENTVNIKKEYAHNGRYIEDFNIDAIKDVEVINCTKETNYSIKEYIQDRKDVDLDEDVIDWLSTEDSSKDNVELKDANFPDDNNCIDCFNRENNGENVNEWDSFNGDYINLLNEEGNLDENKDDFLNIESKNGKVTNTKSIEERIIVPPNIRDFIRQNSGVTIEYALKFYSKKEIDKALMLGKIYKKKGKLII